MVAMLATRRERTLHSSSLPRPDDSRCKAGQIFASIISNPETLPSALIRPPSSVTTPSCHSEPQTLTPKPSSILDRLILYPRPQVMAEMIEDEGKSMRELIEQMQGPEENLLDVERKEEVMPAHGVLGVGANALQIVSGEDPKRSCDFDTLERFRAA